MQSAPAAIPAMIEVSFPAGFAPAEATLEDLNTTLSAISSARPVCSANPITGTKPGARDQTLVIEDRDRPRPAIL